MAHSGLGDKFNVVADASGADIQLKHGQTVEFVSFLAAGTQGLTVQETIDGAGGQALAVLDKLYKSEGAGGTWDAVTQAASDAYTHADGTKNCVVFSVRGRQLSEGFNCVNVTAAAGTLTAIIHDLVEHGDPTFQASPV